MRLPALARCTPTVLHVRDAGLYRHRHGTRREARRRLLGARTFFDLVEPPVWPEVAETRIAPGFSRCTAQTREITVDEALAKYPYDAAFAYAHELGHMVDHQMLDDASRRHFQEAVGLASEPWRYGEDNLYCKSPCEAFATAFAVSSCPGPWRCELFVSAPWYPVLMDVVLSTFRAVTWEVLGTPQRAATGERERS